MEQNELKQLMQQSAQDAVNITSEEFQITLDFSLTSIALVDDVLLSFVDRYQEQAQTDQAVFTIANVYGAYLGEVFIRHYGGHWKLADEASATVVVEKDVNTYAFAGICYERLVKDPNISVLKYFSLASGQPAH